MAQSFHPSSNQDATGASPECENKFASRSQLQQWIPKVDLDYRRYPRTRWFKAQPYQMLGLQVGVVTAILVINTTCAIMATRDSSWSGQSGTIYQRSCSSIKNVDSFFHLAINIMSTILLGASNYCMQIIVSPTRRELDHAHQSGRWFDIGVPSWRNLKRIPRHRRLVWLLLGLSSMPLHLFWNSAIFSSFPFVAYRVAFAASDFDMNNNTWEKNADLQQSAKDGNFNLINNTECITRYLNSQSGAGDVVVVTTFPNGYNGTSLIKTFGPRSDVSTITAWVCASPQYDMNATNYCWVGNMIPVAKTWTVNITNKDIPVQHCFATEDLANMDDWCGLHFNAVILIIICAVNFFQAVSILFTWAFLVQLWHWKIWHWKLRHWKRKLLIGNEEDFQDYTPMVTVEDAIQSPGGNEEDFQDYRPMVTVGDAIQSFLERPDDTTKGMCLASQKDFQLRRGSWPTAGPQIWKGEVEVHRLKLASKKYWISASLPGVALIIAVAGILGSTLHLQISRGVNEDAQNLKEDFGQVNSLYLVNILKQPSQWQFWGSVLFSNSWQLLLSLTYVLYNSVITKVSTGVEWSRFGFQRATLRTSHPRGLQRSAYFLSLPYKYSVSLKIVLGFLHWLISQSVFLAASHAFTPTGERFPSGDTSRPGYSLLGMILCVSVGTGLLLFLPVFAFRKVTFRLPVVTTSSAAISASCHRHSADKDVQFLPVKWGVVPQENGDGKDSRSVKHCVFTTHADVCPPTEGDLYE